MNTKTNIILVLSVGDFILINYKMSKNYTFSALLKQVMIVIVLKGILVVSTCTLSINNCAACHVNYTNACISCNAGYNWISYSCCSNTLTNCAVCAANSSRCDGCGSPGQYLSNNTCFPCSTSLNFCATCSSSTNCTSCESFFYTVNSTSSKCQLCSEFMEACLNCTAQSLCTVCINNSYAVNTTSHHCQNCSQLLTNCTNCNNQATCIKCRTDPFIVLSVGKCKPCLNVIPKCLTCTNPNWCTKCGNYYALKYSANTSACYACSVLMMGCLNCSSSMTCTNCSVGSVVIGGCSIVAGCKVVVQASPSAICISCRTPQFYAFPTNGTCFCTVGHLAGKYCTEILGCTNIARTAAGDYCTSCNAALHFYNINNTCICQQYFQLKGQQCLEICGDGKLFNLPCDDGNTINGDGCSSSCNVEVGFSCNSTNNQKSKCVYLIKMNMYLDCVYHLNGNTANIVFRISPSIYSFFNSNLTNRIRFNTSLNFFIVSYEIVDIFLYVKIEYQQDIQNGQAIAIIGYDHDYFASPDSTIPFTLTECNGDLLLYDPNPSEGKEEVVTIAVKVICGLVWLSWLVGSYSHKMIGVETLHTIQLIFIMQAFALRYRPVIVYFKSLNNVLNGYQKLLVYSQAVTSNERYEFLNFSSDLINNTFILAMVSLPCFFFYLYLVFRQKIEMQDSNSSLKLTQLKVLKSVRKWIKYQYRLYRYFVFPLMMGLFLHFILSLMIQSNVNIQKQSSSQLFSTLLSLYMTSSIFILFSKEIFLSKSADTTQSHKIGYTFKYLVTIFLVAIIIQIFLSGIVDDYSIYFVAGAQIFYSAIVLLFRPYNHLVHTSSLLINQIGIVLNIIWIVSQQFFRFKRQTEEIFAFCLIGWMLVIVICSFARAFYQIKTKKRHQIESVTKRIKKKFIDNDDDQFFRKIDKDNQMQFNQYCLNSELLKKQLIPVAQKNMNILIGQGNRKDAAKSQFKRLVNLEDRLIDLNERQAL